MEKNDAIYIPGHNGMLGSAIVRKLDIDGYTNLVTKSSKELDLRVQFDVDNFIRDVKPQFIFLAAAKVGGIHANMTYPAEFIYDNLAIQTNLIHAAYRHGVKKLLFLGSSCIYPKFANQPIHESALLTDLLEPTNEFYAIAKIAGIKMCQAYRQQYGCNFIAAMPTNLYGPNDNYDLQNSHVVPALLRKFIEAKKNNFPSVTIWGTGNPKREFMHVDDMADAALFLMKNYNDSEHINVGTGKEISISDLALLIKRITEYDGKIVYDNSKPDGMKRKRLDVSNINQLGWQSKIELEEGLGQVYQSIRPFY